MDRLQALFWKVVFKHGPAPKANAHEPLLLCFKSLAAAREIMFAVTFHTRRQPLQAALLVLHKMDFPAADGVLLSLSVSAPGLEHPEMELCSEATAIFNMAQEATDWKMELLHPGPILALSRFDIMSQSAVDEAEFPNFVAEAVPVPQNIADVLDAFDVAHPNPRAQKRKRPRPTKPGPKKKRKMSKEEAAQTHIQQEKKLQGLTPMDSESEQGQATETEDEDSVDYSGKPTKSAYLASDVEGEMEMEEVETENAGRPVASSSSASGLGLRPSTSEPASASSSRPAPVPELAQGSATGTKRATHRRGEPWGVFHISPVFSLGRHTGWEAQCNMRSNEGDSAGHSCKKSISRNIGLSHLECQLRLKRWLVAGLDDSGWPDNSACAATMAPWAALD